MHPYLPAPRPGLHPTKVVTAGGGGVGGGGGGGVLRREFLGGVSLVKKGYVYL